MINFNLLKKSNPLTSFPGDKYCSRSRSLSSNTMGSGLTRDSENSVIWTPLARALAGRPSRLELIVWSLQWGVFFINKEVVHCTCIKVIKVIAKLDTAGMEISGSLFARGD